MNHQFIEVRELIAKARESLHRGDKASAWQLGKRAAVLAPSLEDVWLVLAASDPDPHDALAYAQKARQINPHSTRAQRAVEWTVSRLKQIEALKDRLPVSALPRRADVAVPQKQHAYQTAIAMPVLRSQSRNWLLPALSIGVGILLIGFIVLFALTRPMLASLVSGLRLPAATQENLWAPVDMAKPEATPIDVSAFVVQATNTPAPALAATVTQAPTSEPTSTDIPTEAPTVVPSATETPGSMLMEILADTPTNVPPTPGISVGNGVRWIDVDLTNQMVYAYEGDVVVNSFLVSTGTWLTPTVTGKHKIWIKVRVQDMKGPGYYLPDVPYVMFFYRDYGLHGTYWHNNFGTPMSHGCVNLRTEDAAWLFNWASVGTIVNVHY
jgi:lipoprotein-anchoring transpeptidase ErfK/SrfK